MGDLRSFPGSVLARMKYAREACDDLCVQLMINEFVLGNCAQSNEGQGVTVGGC